MKVVKVCLILALSVAGSSLLFSQQAPTLTPDQQQQFDSQKLTLSIEDTISSKRWEAIKGYEDIKEPDFLRLLGLDKEALDSQSHQANKTMLMVGGIGLAAVGLIVTLIPAFSPPMTTDSFGYSIYDAGTALTYEAAGAVIAAGGAVMIVVGATQPRDITPYGQAKALAEKYNAQLLIKITGKE